MNCFSDFVIFRLQFFGIQIPIASFPIDRPPIIGGQYSQQKPRVFKTVFTFFRVTHCMIFHTAWWKLDFLVWFHSIIAENSRIFKLYKLFLAKNMVWVQKFFWVHKCFEPKNFLDKIVFRLKKYLYQIFFWT